MGLKEPYVAITDIDYTNLPNDISAFFYNSEQVPTVISIASQCTNDGKILCAGAFMVQLLPNADESFITKLEQKVQAIRPMNELMLGGMTLEQIANLLYDDMDTEDDSLVEEFEILENKEVRYQCDCNSDRFYRGILTLGKDDLKHIFEEEKEIEAECQFCGKRYKFLEKDFEEVLKYNSKGLLQNATAPSYYISIFCFSKFYISLVTTTSTPVPKTLAIIISPLLTGAVSSIFFNSSINLKFNSFGIACFVFTGHLASRAFFILTVEVTTLFGAVNSSLP